MDVACSKEGHQLNCSGPVIALHLVFYDALNLGSKFCAPTATWPPLCGARRVKPVEKLDQTLATSAQSFGFQRLNNGRCRLAAGPEYESTPFQILAVRHPVAALWVSNTLQLEADRVFMVGEKRNGEKRNGEWNGNGTERPFHSVLQKRKLFLDSY